MKTERKKIDADVLLVPAADMLLLTIMFIAIAGNLVYRPAVPVRLPVSGTAETVPEDNPTVTLTPGGGIFLNGRKVSTEGLEMILELSAKLSEREGEKSILVIRSDQGVEYRHLLEIINIAGDAGITNIALATREER